MIDFHPARRQLRPVLVICAAPDLSRNLNRLCLHGVAARGLIHWEDLGCIAENGEVIIIFIDGFDDAQVLSYLRSLEHRRSGPALIAVTNRTPPIWFPSLPRELPALVVDHGAPGRLFDALAACSAALDERDAGVEEPELPFTD